MQPQEPLLFRAHREYFFHRATVNQFSYKELFGDQSTHMKCLSHLSSSDLNKDHCYGYFELMLAETPHPSCNVQPSEFDEQERLGLQGKLQRIYSESRKGDSDNGFVGTLVLKYQLRHGSLIETYQIDEGVKVDSGYRLCTFEFRDENDRTHRDPALDLPAFAKFSSLNLNEQLCVHEKFYVHGKIHRDLGPAIISMVSAVEHHFQAEYYTMGAQNNPWGPALMYFRDDVMNGVYDLQLSQMKLGGNHSLHLDDNSSNVMTCIEFMLYCQDMGLSVREFVTRYEEDGDLSFDFQMRFGYNIEPHNIYMLKYQVFPQEDWGPFVRPSGRFDVHA